FPYTALFRSQGQRDIGQDAGEPIVQGHEEDNHRAANPSGPQAPFNRVTAQQRADGAVLDDLDGDGERAAAQQHGQGPRVGQVVETATDLPAAAADRRADDRRGDDL